LEQFHPAATRLESNQSNGKQYQPKLGSDSVSDTRDAKRD
jgi:hypothetical protein